MFRLLVPAVVASLATLFVALPFTADAASEPTRAPVVPKRLVVDSVSAPVVSIDQAAQIIEIVLVPDGEYHPVHPDSVETTDSSTAQSSPAPLADNADRR